MVYIIADRNPINIVKLYQLMYGDGTALHCLRASNSLFYEK